MAKIETEVSVRIDVDNSEAVKSVAELKDQIKLASQNLEILKTTFGENSAEVQLSSKYIASLSNQLKTLEVSGESAKQIAELNNQIKLASTSLIGLKEKFGENSAEVIAVEKNISDLKTQLQSVELGTQAIDSLNLINDGIDSTTQSVTALDSELNKIDVPTQAVDSLNAIDSSINSTTQNATELNNQLGSLDSKQIDINANTDAATNSIGEINQELDAINSKTIDVALNSEPVTNSINEINTELDAVDSKNIELTADNSAIKNSIGEVNNELNSLESKDVSINADNTNAIKSVDELKSDVNSIESKSIELNADNTNAVNGIDEVIADVEKVPNKKTIELNADNNAAKTIGELSNQLKIATANVDALKIKFGENSAEVKLAEAEVEKLNNLLANPKVSDAPAKSVVGLKQQLKESQKELLGVIQKFGETSTEASNAAKKVADLKDTIGDAKALTDAFNPDRKFQAFSGALQSVAGGFAAVQGAQALFGSQSKDLEKTLVKVQGALALSQGINSILEAKDSFKVLKSVLLEFNIVQKVVAIGTRLWNAALAANPIGAIVTVVAALIAGIVALTSYFISNANAAKAQAKSVEESTKALEKQAKTLERNNQEFEKSQNQKLALAKANGETAESIRKLELKLADEKIAYEVSTRAVAQNTLEKEKNKLANLKLQGASDETIAAQLENVKKAVEGYNTENKKVQSAYDERTAIVNKHIVEVATEQTAANNKESEERKKAFEKAKADRDAANKEFIENNKNANAELKKVREQNAIDELKTEKEKAYKKLEQDNENEGERINALNISNDLKLKLLDENSKTYQLQKQKLDEQFAKEDEAKQTEYLNRLNDLKEQIKIDGIKNEFDKELEVINDNYKKQYAEIDANIKLDAQQKLELKKQLQIKEISEIDAVEQKRNEDILNRQLTELDLIIKGNDAKIAAKKDAIAQEEALNQEAFDKGIISIDEYTKNVKKYSDERVAIADEEAKTRIDIANSIADSLGKLSELVGKQTAVGKGLAVAQATINTFLGATEVLKQKSVLPEPVATISKVVNVATIIASGIKSVKEILKVKVEGGSGGGTAPNASAVVAPITPQATTTAINQDQVNQLSSATTRAFVVESDVSGSQERIQRLNRAARIN